MIIRLCGLSDAFLADVTFRVEQKLRQHQEPDGSYGCDPEVIVRYVVEAVDAEFVLGLDGRPGPGALMGASTEARQEAFAAGWNAAMQLIDEQLAEVVEVAKHLGEGTEEAYEKALYEWDRGA